MYSIDRTGAKSAARTAQPEYAANDGFSGARAPARTIDIHLAEINQGQPYEGVAKGPRAILDAGLESALTDAGHGLRATTVTSGGPESDMTRGAALGALADQVCSTLTAGRFALTLGGDHSLAFGSIEGVLRACPSARILYIDAHADINTPETSPSGNTHGMPVAAHLGLFEPTELEDSVCVGARLDPSQIAFIGLRDVDDGEEVFLNRLGITRFSTKDVRERGADAILAEALRALDPHGEHPLFVSFDIDVMDPGLVPATGVPVSDGLHMNEMTALTRGVARTGRLIGLDLVEVNPDLAPNPDSLTRSVDIAIMVIANMLSR